MKSSIQSMARQKATITVDAEKLRTAQALTGSSSVSGTVDVALTHLIRSEQLRRDVEAYRAVPPTDEEIAFASTLADSSDIDDDTDWDAVYADSGDEPA
jgi:hypothetical protein